MNPDLIITLALLILLTTALTLTVIRNRIDKLADAIKLLESTTNRIEHRLLLLHEQLDPPQPCCTTQAAPAIPRMTNHEH